MSKIPKKIHYCWFGKKEKPVMVKKCIESWKNRLPEYEIIEWNESNFDFSDNIFAKEAYQLGQYAFVSDYVRVFVLYNYGGIYLDTDVEVIKSLDHFLDKDSFWGFEEANRIATSTIGCKKGNELLKKFLESYKDKRFIMDDGQINNVPNVCTIGDILEEYGVKLNGLNQEIKNIATIYEQEYFSPYDYINCYMKKTNNTYTVHHFYKSWVPLKDRVKSNIKKFLVKIIGVKNLKIVRSFVNKK